MSVRSRWATVVTVAGIAWVGVAPLGCKPREAGFEPPPPPEVSVAAPIVRTLPQTLEFTGVASGSEQVDVRARVRGFIQSRSVTGGEKVKANDPLFVIDPRPFEAVVRQAQAEVAQNEARLRLAQITLERRQQSAAGQAISKLELDQAVADRDGANAALDLSKAKLSSAQLDLDYTQVRAPIDGRVSINVPDVGELVGDNSNQVLCTIINDATIYVTFNVPEQTVLALRKQFLNQRPGENGRPTIPIYVGFANDGTTHPFAGRYEGGDPGFDPGTGTTVVRGIFDNASGRMVPGAFARILTVIGEETVTLVPDAAVNVDQQGRFVLAVNAQDVVERVPVEAAGVIGQMRKLTTPLPEGTRVIVNGLQRARPGVPVKATRVELKEPNLDVGVSGASTQPSTQQTTMPTTAVTTTMPTR